MTSNHEQEGQHHAAGNNNPHTGMRNEMSSEAISITRYTLEDANSSLQDIRYETTTDKYHTLLDPGDMDMRPTNELHINLASKRVLDMFLE
jgi:hypothetical protein